MIKKLCLFLRKIFCCCCISNREKEIEIIYQKIRESEPNII
jgi:hypothetical protein